MALNSKIILVSDFGRSGQGWLSYMLCYILNAAFVEPYNFLEGKKYTTSEHIFSLTQGDLPGREKTKYSLIVKTHSFLLHEISLTDKIIFLMRDPRDVAVSMHNLNLIQERSINWTHPRAKFFLVFKKCFRLLSYINTISHWKRHYYSWKKSQYYPIKYEDLLGDCKKALEKILEYLEVSVEEKVINEAVKNFSFKKITGRTRGQENKNSTEFRKGVAGDHKNKFSKFELKIINFLFKDLFKELNYEVDS